MPAVTRAGGGRELVEVEDNAEAGPSTPSYTAPDFHFSRSSPPNEIWSLHADELDSEADHNFWRSSRWCPDGSAVLTTTEDRCLRLYQTPLEDDSPVIQGATIPCPDSIVSTAWYPLASASAPETFCFAASIRDSPVRLIDASDGKVRATYGIIDHRERFIGPHSMAFNPSATHLYCGHESSFEVLDITNPGSETGERIKTASVRSEKGSQKGIISAMAFCPDQSGMYAAGSFLGGVSLYSEDTDCAVGHLEGVLGGGITQVAFHPLLPHYLYVASRRSTHLQVFDARNLSCPVGKFERSASTNQRLSFDVDPWGRFLAAGDEHGVLRVWAIESGQCEPPIFEQQLHDDAISSVQFHPFKPVLMTSSGSRSLRAATVDSLDEDTDSDSDSDPPPRPSRSPPASGESRLSFWDFSSS